MDETRDSGHAFHRLRDLGVHHGRACTLAKQVIERFSHLFDANLANAMHIGC
jgi:hypothetical protein